MDEHASQVIVAERRRVSIAGMRPGKEDDACQRIFERNFFAYAGTFHPLGKSLYFPISYSLIPSA
jgi:hypothetical protein